MKEIQQKTAIRRILVALDASPHSLAALEAAAELAKGFGAELMGLFVEDINVLRLAEFPFAREISLFSPVFRQLHAAQLERNFRAQANQMRQSLASIAEQNGLSWTFRVARGEVGAEVLSAEAEADLMIVGRTGRSFGGPTRVGSTVRTLLLQGRGLTLILQHGKRLALPIMVIYDGSPPAKKALEVAEHLGKAKDGGLRILIVAESESSGEELRQDVDEQLRSPYLMAGYRVLINPSSAMIARLIEMEGDIPLVLPCGRGIFHGERLCGLINVVSNPVLLVR